MPRKNAPRKGATGPTSTYRIPGIGDVTKAEYDFLTSNERIQEIARAKQAGLTDQKTALEKVAEILRVFRFFKNNDAE